MGLKSFFSQFVTDEIEDIVDGMFEQQVSEISDPFGMESQSLKKTLSFTSLLYKYYFRCKTTGITNIPSGPVILAANHGGQLPFDAVMISTSVMLNLHPPRMPRGLMDRFVPTLPFISAWYAKLGVATGTPENAELLLNRGEMLLTFPEGVKGIQKRFSNAYELQKFGHGFVRLALAFNVPIVPVSVVGAEEQYPTLYTIKRGTHLLNTPSIPIWLQMPIPLLGLLPLPVKYYIHFGEPFYFKGDPDDDDDVIGEMTDMVKSNIRERLTSIRKSREGIF